MVMYGVLSTTQQPTTQSDDVRIRLNQIFIGRFTYCSRYSPDFKPVERLFALVKQEIRSRYDNHNLDPVVTIVEVFNLFIVGGPCAAVI